MKAQMESENEDIYKEIIIVTEKLDKLEQMQEKMKSEIADSLEFWDYSPNNNPLARDILETVNTFCAKVGVTNEVD